MTMGGIAAMRTLVCWLLLLLCAPVCAFDYCVDDATALQTILDEAATNGEDDHIRLVQGFYSVPSGGFEYEALDSRDLEISGGWVGICLGRGGDAFDTTLDGGATEKILYIVANQRSVKISRLLFLNGESNLGGGLHILFALNAVIERNAFVANRANFSGSAAYVSDGINEIRFMNNLFVVNDGGPVVEARQTGGEGIYFINNTVVANTAPEDASVEINVGGGASALVANNILWDNSGVDLDLSESSGDLFYWHNNVADYRGPPIGVNNVARNPRFIPGVFSYELASDSRLIDTGVLPSGNPGAFEGNWSVGDVDFEGDIRVQGSVVDMGAFEASDVLFASSFGGD